MSTETLTPEPAALSRSEKAKLSWETRRANEAKAKEHETLADSFSATEAKPDPKPKSGHRFELDETAHSPQNSGSFQPNADQHRFCSFWGIVEGPHLAGFWSIGELCNTGIRTSDGRGRVIFEPYDGGSGYHDIQKGTTKLRECICSREDMMKKQAHEGQISTDAMRRFTNTRAIPATANQVGRQVLECSDSLREAPVGSTF